MRTIWLKNVLRKITMFFNLFFSTTFLINRNYSTDLSGTRNENKRLPAGWISFAGTDDACNSEHGSMHHLYRFLFTEKARERKKRFPFPIEQHHIGLSCCSAACILNQAWQRFIGNKKAHLLCHRISVQVNGYWWVARMVTPRRITYSLIIWYHDIYDLSMDFAILLSS